MLFFLFSVSWYCHKRGIIHSVRKIKDNVFALKRQSSVIVLIPSPPPPLHFEHLIKKNYVKYPSLNVLSWYNLQSSVGTVKNYYRLCACLHNALLWITQSLNAMVLWWPMLFCCSVGWYDKYDFPHTFSVGTIRLMLSVLWVYII